MASGIEHARLAAAVNILRPDWQTSSVQTLLNRDHWQRPYRDLAVALVWLACDPDTRTPARLAQHGPWWTAANSANPTPTPDRYKADRTQPAAMPDELRQWRATHRRSDREA